ncbi:AraC family transcriptional regulator [uncultured Ruminococcus sp.]|uniref:helix-turn-helix transcriptional regulator n=1 Tax=uncultured Ruminococcus sp. TaxID=165186 RepID=UPI0026193D37|nr:AraC family transcriptional regulator [uncultured Ruminococcus sp.]
MDTQEYIETVENAWTRSERILCTPSGLARKALFYVQEIGTLTCKQSHRNARDSLDSYLLVLIQKGSGVFTVGNESYTVRQGDIVFLDCHQPYSHCSSESDPWQFSWVHWNGYAMPALYEMFRQRHSSIVIPRAAAHFLPKFEQIKESVLKQPPDFELFVSQYLTQIVTQLVTANTGEFRRSVGEMSEKWGQIHRYLEEHFADKITLEELSQKFEISKFYMLRGFKKKYGVTIVQFINQCRMNYAKKLLRFTDLQVDEIAERCGIHDSSYFNRIFRTTEGISAGSYRKQWRN